jgi:outer membrane protein assembly factor BamB
MGRLAFLSSCLIAVFLFDSPDAGAQEWTRFRGPNGTGESEATSIPAKWTDRDYRWVIDLPGMGHSSPVLWGNRLFLLSADPKTATRFVLCYDVVKGGELWKREFPSAPHHLHTMSSYASCTPAVDEDHVYVAWSTPASVTFMALSHAGNIVWQKDLGPWRSQHGFGTSPIVFEDLVILSNSQEAKDGPNPAETTPDSYVMAFDRNTGVERWRTRRITDNVSYSVPAVFQPKGGRPQLVNISTGSGMYAIDPSNGEELWSTVVFDKRTVSSPVVKGDLIFGSTGSGGGGSYVTAVRCDGKQPEVVWNVKLQAPYVPTVVARGDLLFLMSDAGVASCVDLNSGEVHWRNRIGGNFQGSPIRIADKLYCVSVDGEVVVLAADKQFEELGRMTLGEGSRSTPAVAGNSLYIRTFSKLFAIGGTASPPVSVKN